MKRKGSKLSFDPQTVSRQGGQGKNDIQIPEGSNYFLARTGRGRDYIQQGKVKLTVVSEQGKEAVVAILEPGQFFGRRMSQWPSAAHGINEGDR